MVTVSIPGSLKTQWKNIYILTVVSIVGVIQQSVVPPQVFPYMRMLDPEVPTFYDKDTYHDTGKMCAITSCTVYLLVEYFKTTYAQKVAFVAYEFFSGLSMGAVGILRAYVAMASTESDRSRAVAITTMSIPLGILIGPVIQLLFTPIGYPGVTVFTGGHINMYTAPVIFALLCNIMALLLLIFYFKDKTTYKI
ncbi:hypothetical protein L596_021548 [Steinernema carpocapsae]|uniref:Major facilitator superfamily (MFS) profile domain-containing protein n=1 Tax=Steinernema carpocapsae TaxID=34508 RepID=A0A4U5MJ49_STECR|nr:hypothetical protein L596_021548 [Steinernema carpocapsae]